MYFDCKTSAASRTHFDLIQLFKQMQIAAHRPAHTATIIEPSLSAIFHFYVYSSLETPIQFQRSTIGGTDIARSRNPCSLAVQIMSIN